LPAETDVIPISIGRPVAYHFVRAVRAWRSRQPGGRRIPMAEAAEPDPTELAWRTALTERHVNRWAFLPSSPRCVGCRVPFAGIGGRLMSFTGYRQSRKNPNLCNLCDDILPQGGAEVDVGVLFADVRGSTSLAERIGPRAFAEALNRFYHVATNVLLSHDAMIDKMVGDEVMALFIPAICSGEHRKRAAESALTLAREVKNLMAGDEPLPVGIGVHAGPAFVGKIGSSGVHDFTALGDTVNTAARLQSEAKAGQVAASREIFEAAPEYFDGATPRSVELRGKAEPFTIYVTGMTAGTSEEPSSSA
jgi:adenylate cyclase